MIILTLKEKGFTEEKACKLIEAALPISFEI